MSSRELLDIHNRYCAHNYSPLDIIIESGNDVWLTDVEGRRYLDMHSAYSGINFGHSNPDIIKAVKDQLDRLTLTSRAFIVSELGPFCQELSTFCSMEMVLPMNTGVEAVETAIKLARRWGYQKKGITPNRAEIVCFTGNFHGRTIAVISASDSPSSTTDFGPFTPGFKLVQYGDLDAVKAAVTDNTAAIFFEPIQGEAGVILPPDGFVRGLREIATSTNTLLIADEIQTGFYRTGNRFACNYEKVQPDVYVLGKSLGGGVLPVSAVVSSRDVMSVFTPGSHGSTFSGNPLACAVGRAVLRYVQAHPFEDRVTALGEHLRGRLLGASLKKVKQVRGRGLFFGIDIDPAVGKAKKVCEQLKDKGVLCKDTRDYSIRIAPPLTITKQDLDWGIDRLIEVLN